MDLDILEISGTFLILFYNIQSKHIRNIRDLPDIVIYILYI